MEGKIKVAIVEDDLEWIELLKILLFKEEDILLVGVATNKDEAVRLSQALVQIDIFLVDINLTENNLDGILVALELREKNYSGKVIMLTSMMDEEIVRKSFVAGVSNYMLKKNAPELPSIIRKAHAERTPIEILANDYCRLKKEEKLKVLTPAERQLYELAESGMTRIEMERKLLKSENTIKGQIKKLLRKLEASNTKEAIRKVKSGGIL